MENRNESFPAGGRGAGEGWGFIQPAGGRGGRVIHPDHHVPYQGPPPALGLAGYPNQMNQPRQLGVLAGNQIRPTGAPNAGGWRRRIMYSPPGSPRSPAPPRVVQILQFAGRPAANVMERSRRIAESLECEISEELSDKVFENPLLRERILDHVIFSSNGAVSRADVQNIRLVRKSWLFTAADCLHQHKQPLFHLTIDTDNSSVEEVSRFSYGYQLLHDFASSMTSSTRFLDVIPPFSLRLESIFFRDENYRNLAAFLASCGEALVNMDLSFPMTDTIPSASPLFNLPQLQRLSVNYSRDHLPGEEVPPFTEAINLLPIILRNVPENLKELTFSFFSRVPPNFNAVLLPQSITKLSFEGPQPLTNSDLGLLIRNELPNLTSLTLYAVSTRQNSTERIFEILNKFRTTLRSLSLHGRCRAWDFDSWNIHTLLRLPRMENLEFLTVTSKCWMFSEEVFQLNEQLPKLKELEILNTKEFERWTENLMFPEVRKLSVSIVSVEYEHEVLKTMTFENMERLHRTFPNIIELEITVTEPMVDALRYLFENMGSLQKLAIILEGSVYAQKQHGRGHWDSQLTGLSRHLIKRFYRCQEYDEKMASVSIRKLTALTSLTLKEEFTPICNRHGRASERFLISDVAFYCALLKMPNLVNLHLHGRFGASKKMAAQWRKEKGTEIKQTYNRD